MRARVINPLQALLTSHKSTYKNQQAKHISAKNTYAALRENLERKKNVFLKKCKEVEDAYSNYDASKEQSEEKKYKIKAKIITLTGECKDEEAKYIFLFNQSREGRINYIQSIVIIYFKIK